MELKLPVTLIPVLVGFDPDVTLTLRSVEFPACNALGLAEPVPVGGVEEGVTVSAMEALPVRACVSVIVAGMVLPPALVAAGTAA